MTAERFWIIIIKIELAALLCCLVFSLVHQKKCDFIDIRDSSITDLQETITNG